MEQLVTNLVGNAVKYGQAKPIDVELSTFDDRASITVRDQGIGIGSREQARIFFGTVRACGLGRTIRWIPAFGLWIARQVVEASGGKISVKERSLEKEPSSPCSSPAGRGGAETGRRGKRSGNEMKR